MISDRIGLAVAFLALSSAPVAAQDDLAAATQAMNNLSHEYAICSAYFMVVGVAMENSNDPVTAQQYNEVADAALVYAAVYGEVAGLLPETTSARFNMALTEMADRIQNNTSNISILGADYAASCQLAMEDVAGAMDRAFAAQGLPPPPSANSR